MRSEFDLIEYIKKSQTRGNRLGTRALVGIGDDCAVIPKDSESDLLLTADMLVEDVDFRLGWASPADIGHKALAVSLSDVAAMGGSAVCSMLSLGVPESLWKSDFVEMLLDSYSALAARESVELVGGDISRTPERLVIDSTVIGECPRGESVLRSGAQPGDAIYVTGSLGGARAGLALLERGGDGPGSAPLIARQLRPVPRTGVGRRLRELGLPSAMLDISDGLLGDLGHICSQSGVGAELDLTSVPIENGVAQAVGEGPVGSGRFEGLPQPLLTAVAGGEDFELLFTVPADRIASVPDQILGIPLTRIGSVTARGGIEAVGTGGGRVTLAPEGFDHFRGSDL